VCAEFDRLDFLSAVVVKLRSWVIFQATLQRFSNFSNRHNLLLQLRQMLWDPIPQINAITDD
jgi:hypothetical protein